MPDFDELSPEEFEELYEEQTSAKRGKREIYKPFLLNLEDGTPAHLKDAGDVTEEKIWVNRRGQVLKHAKELSAKTGCKRYNHVRVVRRGSQLWVMIPTPDRVNFKAGKWDEGHRIYTEEDVASVPRVPRPSPYKSEKVIQGRDGRADGPPITTSSSPACDVTMGCVRGKGHSPPCSRQPLTARQELELSKRKNGD